MKNQTFIILCAGFMLVLFINKDNTYPGNKTTALEKENIELKEKVIIRDSLIIEGNQRAFEYFETASALTLICDSFKSSREAKFNYYKNK